MQSKLELLLAPLAIVAIFAAIIKRYIHAKIPLKLQTNIQVNVALNEIDLLLKKNKTHQIAYRKL